MASTKADNNRCVWQYTDDLGGNHAVSAKSVYVLDGTDGAKYGGSAPETSVRPIPKGLRMRAVKCVDATGFAIWVTAYESDALLWTTAGTQITRNKNGVDTVFEATSSHRGERWRDGIRQTA